MSGKRVCVIGAGSSGLAALKGLVSLHVDVEAFEAGSAVGGNWRYENDNGHSAAYASLRTNVSRRRMQYPSFPMPSAFGDYIHHADMAAYLEAHASASGLIEHIHFRAVVETAEPGDGRWTVRLRSGEERVYDAVVVANGHDWNPYVPELPGSFDGPTLHSHDYRTPEVFAHQRVLVVGAGQSAIELAIEVGQVASRTILAVRQGRHLIPRYLLGRPADAFDQPLTNRLPWPVVRSSLAAIARLSSGRSTGATLRPGHRLLEREAPVVGDGLVAALRKGAVALRTDLRELLHDGVCFADGSTENVDTIIFATGYRPSFPFLRPTPPDFNGRRLPLYRRMVHPDVPGLFFIGLVDPVGGLLPVVELQGEWIAAIITLRRELPPPEQMHLLLRDRERRAHRRFGSDPANGLLVDRYEYMRTLRADLRGSRGQSW